MKYTPDIFNRGGLLLALCCMIVFVCGEAVMARAEDHAAGDTGVRTLYLIRHGAYDTADQRDPDVGKALIPLGVAQARLLGARLRALPTPITSLHSSTMTRAHQTAAVIGEMFPELEVQQSRQLRECLMPTWREDVMRDEDPDEVAACLAQVEMAFTEYFRPAGPEDEHDIIVCHGNVIRYFVTRVLQVETRSWLQMTIGNCSLTVVRIFSDGRMKLVSYGDVGHLPPNLQTFTGRRHGRLVVPGE